MSEELIHQKVRDRGMDADGPGHRIACGEDINLVKSSSLCALVTCPKCLEWQKKVVDTVFTPLNDQKEAASCPPPC